MPPYAWVLVAAARSALEAGVSRWARRPLYGLLDTEVGLALTIGWAVGAIATAGLSALTLAFCYQLACRFDRAEECMKRARKLKTGP